MTSFAVVLGGGGYAGTAFHAGALTMLARAGYDAREADVLIGTSAGAAAASLIGAGFPPLEYAALVMEEPISREAAGVMEGMGGLRRAPRPGSLNLRPAAPRLLIDGIKRRLPVGVLIAAATPTGTVDVQTVSPGYGPAFRTWPAQQVWITAVSLADGRRAVFGRDRTATIEQAVSASVAIPGYFAPVVIDGVPYVDGGAWSTNNTDLAGLSNAELVLVSAPSGTPDPRGRDLPNLLRIPVARQLRREVAALRKAGRRVVVLEPDRLVRDVIGANSMALHRRAPITLAAMTAADRVLARAGLSRR